jgi:hypothetical protein
VFGFAGGLFFNLFGNKGTMARLIMSLFLALSFLAGLAFYTVACDDLPSR